MDIIRLYWNSDNIHQITRRVHEDPRGRTYIYYRGRKIPVSRARNENVWWAFPDN